jgi:hypothetical protein
MRKLPILTAVLAASGMSLHAGFSFTLGWVQGLGAIASLAADPRNPPTLYASAANAIWRSTDAGGKPG